MPESLNMREQMNKLFLSLSLEQKLDVIGFILKLSQPQEPETTPPLTTTTQKEFWDCSADVPNGLVWVKNKRWESKIKELITGVNKDGFMLSLTTVPFNFLCDNHYFYSTDNGETWKECRKE